MMFCPLSHQNGMSCNGKWIVRDGQPHTFKEDADGWVEEHGTRLYTQVLQAGAYRGTEAGKHFVR